MKRELCILGHKLDVTLVLFKNVTNSKSILESYNKNICDSTDINHFFFLLDSELVYNENHILNSIYRAYHNFITKKRITKNIIIEILFLLSAHENINECVKQYQVRDFSISIIYVGVNIRDKENDAFMDLIAAEKVDFDELPHLHNKKKMLDNFKCLDAINLEKFIYHNIASKKLNL